MPTNADYPLYSMPGSEIEAERRRLETEWRNSYRALRAVVGETRAPSGLTPDAVKFSPEWQAARGIERAAFAALRRFNTVYKPRRA